MRNHNPVRVDYAEPWQQRASEHMEPYYDRVEDVGWRDVVDVVCDDIIMQLAGHMTDQPRNVAESLEAEEAGI